jgi:hypothetical protein
VVDVPPKLSARVRLLDSGRSDKTDSHDARAAAVVALRHRSLRPVGVEDHVAVLRLLAKRHYSDNRPDAGHNQPTTHLYRLLSTLCVVQRLSADLARRLTALRRSCGEPGDVRRRPMSRRRQPSRRGMA